jgi:hypothetical protein
MLGRIDCETCDGYGEVEVLTLEGDWVEVYCKPCGGAGGFALHGPPTREQVAEVEAQAAAREVAWARWATFSCTHCRFYCDAHLERGPRPCHACPEGIIVPLRDLQAAARGALAWRRKGDEVVAIEPPDPAQGDLFAAAKLEVRNVDGALDEIVATGARVHLEGLSDFNRFEDEDACWWIMIRVGDEQVDVWLSAKAPISVRVEQSTKEPNHG